MTIGDGLVTSAIVGLASFSGYIIKRMSDAYFDQVPKQTETLREIADSFKAHDKASAEAHTASNKAQRQISKNLSKVCTALISSTKNGASGRSEASEDS